MNLRDFREFMAEFLATFVLIAIGCGVNAQVTFGQHEAGDYFSINVGWALAVTLGAYVGFGVSGAHMNPAVTLALAVYRGFPWRKTIPYMAMQMAGAFAGSTFVYFLYADALAAFDGGTRRVVGELATAGIWGTYPQAYLTTMGGLIDQIGGTALLLIFVFALTDDRNAAPAANLAPLLIGAAVLAVGLTYGLNAGYAINPARDLGPRLFTYVAGWGSEVFTAHHYWWWVPVVGPMIGGFLGGMVYDFFVFRLHPKDAAVKQ